MIPMQIWRLLHLFFAFAFVGTLIASDWNRRAAHATEDWRQRALLWEMTRRLAGMGLGTLLLLGVMGNVLAPAMGYRMSADRWMQWVNGLWLAALAVQAVVAAPGAARLAAVSKAAAGGGPAEGYPAALRRWRVANVVQSVLYLSLLTLMVYRWRA